MVMRAEIVDGDIMIFPQTEGESQVINSMFSKKECFAVPLLKSKSDIITGIHVFGYDLHELQEETDK